MKTKQEMLNMCKENLENAKNCKTWPDFLNWTQKRYNFRTKNAQCRRMASTIYHKLKGVNLNNAAAYCVCNSSANMPKFYIPLFGTQNKTCFGFMP